MNTEQIRAFVLRYLEAEQCDVLEKHPAYVTVKLSPSADKELTNRPYYWSFVERTGAPAETMTCTFIFDPDAYRELHPPQPGPYGAVSTAAPGPSGPPAPGAAAQAGGGAAQPSPAGAAAPHSGGAAAAGGAQRDAASAAAAGPGGATPQGASAAPTAGAVPAASAAPTAGGAQQPGAADAAAAAGSQAAAGSSAGASAAPQGDSILGRYFGFVPTSFTARVPRDEVTFGSRRLEQMFAAARSKGRYVRLFEAYKPESPKASQTVPYETWFVVNFKVELVCDMKKSEIHSLGIHMGTTEIRENVHDWLSAKTLTPRLPAHIYVTPDRITLPRALLYLEEHVERKLKTYDHRWAEEAQLRLEEELNRVSSYYEPLLKAASSEQKAEIEAQYTGRREEIEWQYRPRVQISAINCGLFHLSSANG